MGSNTALNNVLELKSESIRRGRKQTHGGDTDRASMRQGGNSIDLRLQIRAETQTQIQARKNDLVNTRMSFADSMPGLFNGASFWLLAARQKTKYPGGKRQKPPQPAVNSRTTIRVAIIQL